MTRMLGDVPVDTTVYIPFDSFGADGQSIVATGLLTSDVKIYKDGSVTQRTGVAGLVLLDTDGLDFDGMVGLHGLKIDLSDNDDAGFYAADGSYLVAIDDITINSKTVRFWAAAFTIEIAGGAIAVAKAIKSKQDTMETTLGAITAVGPTLAQMTAEHDVLEGEHSSIASGVAAIPTTMVGTDGAATETKQDIMQGNVTDVLADTDEVQQSLADGGFTNLILDLIQLETDKLGDAMPESIANQGSANTPIQALNLMQQILTQFAIVDTTLTVYKKDGTTVLATFTLSDAATPTSLARAT